MRKFSFIIILIAVLLLTGCSYNTNSQYYALKMMLNKRVYDHISYQIEINEIVTNVIITVQNYLYALSQDKSNANKNLVINTIDKATQQISELNSAIAKEQNIILLLNQLKKSILANNTIHAQQILNTLKVTLNNI